MKRRICVRSMVLGAGIMLIGLAVGAIVSPPLIAQRNGVFDKITCRELVVVDSSGKEAIFLNSTKKNNNITIMGKDGGLIGLVTDETEGNGVVIYGKDSQSPPALRLYSHDESGNGIVIQSKHGKEGIYLTTDEDGNRVTINDHYGNPMVHLVSGKSGDGVVVWDKVGNVRWAAPK